jgi:hypothetical protein
MILASPTPAPEVEVLTNAPELKNTPSSSGISQAFLENLMGFLQGKA